MITNVRDNDGHAPAALVYMPKGKHTIHATVNGEPETRTVEVTAEAANALQRDLSLKLEAHKRGECARPCGLFDHEAGKASFLPKRFSWDEAKGVVLEVEWTLAGKIAVEGKDYSYFSPRFALDERGLVFGLVPNGVEVGSLVNNPAFDRIEMIAASKVQEGTPAPARNLEKEEKAPYHGDMDEIKKLLGLPADTPDAAVLAAISDLKKRKDDATKDAADQAVATKAATERAEKAERRAEDAKKECDAMKARLENSAKEAEEAFISAACAAGKIAPKDEEAKAAWRDVYRANAVSACKAMNAISANSALSIVTAGTPSKEPAKSIAELYEEEVGKL